MWFKALSFACRGQALHMLQVLEVLLLLSTASVSVGAVAEVDSGNPELNTSCYLLQHKLHLAAEVDPQDIDTMKFDDELAGADANVPFQLLGGPAARQQQVLKSQLRAIQSAAAMKAYKDKVWKAEHFAACPVPKATPSPLALLSKGGKGGKDKSSTSKASSVKSSRASQCTAGKIPLFSATSGSSTCCPAQSTSCAACATYDTKTKSCGECLGGAFMKEEGLCTICVDVPSWVDLHGRNCAQLRQENVPCGDVLNGGLNSKMACCHCKDGGLDIATPFNYYVKGSILGEPVDGYPWPRTASAYSLNSDCDLASLGLHFDTQTGILSGTPTSQNSSVQETCQVTAYQSRGLNYTATLRLDIESMAFREFADIPDVLYFAPGDTSAEYTAMFPPTCTEPQEVKLDCVPTIPWLVWSNSTATIKQDTSVSSVGGITVPSSKPFSGGICRSGATCGNQSVSATFAVVRAVPWSGFEYPPMWTSTGRSSYAVSAGETLPALTPIATLSKDQTGDDLSPDKWAVTCSAPGNTSFEYNEFTGIGLLGGYQMFELDPSTGVLTISAASNLSLLLYKQATPSFVKQQVQLDCTVHATFGYAAAAVLGHQSQITPDTAVITQSVQILLQDDICWTERQACSELPCPKGYHSKADLGYVNLCTGPICSLTNDKEACCSLGPASNHSLNLDSTISVPTLADCEADPTCGLAMGAGSATYLLRVPNCFPSSACLSIQDQSQWFTGGMYCPIGNGTLHGMVYAKNGTTIQDTRYLLNFLPDLDYVPPGSMSCKLGEYAIRKWSPLDRFTAGNYTFLGPIVGCVSIKDLRSALGITENSALTAAASHSPATDAGIQVSVYADNCTAPQEEAQSENAANTFLPNEVMFDDPNTMQLFDFWLHPCECIPVHWGNHPPVEAQAFQAVPETLEPEKYNVFDPTSKQLSVGAMTCSPTHMLADFVLHSNGVSSSTEEQELCGASCQTNAKCNYFVVSEMLSTANAFCYLFSDCSQPELQPGQTSRIYWLPRTNLCHIANPEGCWDVTLRRHHLNAPRAQNPFLVDGFNSSVMAVASTCDLLQMMGSSAACQTWEYPAFRLPDSHDWKGKSLMPAYFQSGNQLRAACWAEQYRGTYTEASYTCIDGIWQTKQKGFTCNSCLQVAGSLYALHVKQNVQELYFASRLKMHVYAGGQCLNRGLLLGETSVEDKVKEIIVSEVCESCRCCLGGHANCESACQGVFGSNYGGYCAFPTSTDDGQCCGCFSTTTTTTSTTTTTFPCQSCLNGYGDCELACQGVYGSNYGGYCAFPHSTDDGQCCGCSPTTTSTTTTTTTTTVCEACRCCLNGSPSCEAACQGVYGSNYGGDCLFPNSTNTGQCCECYTTTTTTKRIRRILEEAHDYCDDWLVETATLGSVLVRRMRLAETNLCITMLEATAPSSASTSTTSTLLSQIYDQSPLQFDYGLTLSKCDLENPEQQISIDSLPLLFWRTANLKAKHGLQEPKMGKTALDFQVCTGNDTALGGFALSGGNVCRTAQLVDVEVYEDVVIDPATSTTTTTVATATVPATTSPASIPSGLTAGPLPPPGYYCPYGEPACTICGGSLCCYNASTSNEAGPACYIKCPDGTTSPGGIASVGKGVTCNRENLKSTPPDPYEVRYSMVDVMPLGSQTASMIKVADGNCLTYHESSEALVLEACTGSTSQLFYFGFYGSAAIPAMPVAPELAAQILNKAAGPRKCMGLTLPYQTPALANLTSGTLGFTTCTNIFDTAGGNCSWTNQVSQCYGLSFNAAATATECEAACCQDADCHIWQFDGPGNSNECWMGTSQDCSGGTTWTSGGRKKASAGNQLWYFGVTDAVAPLGPSDAVALMQPSTNLFLEFSPGDEFGATCTCPNGQVYFVSDAGSGGSDCASMCVGGTIGPDTDTCTDSNEDCTGCGGGMGVICGSPRSPAGGWTCVNTAPGADGAYWLPVRCSEKVGYMECLSSDAANCQWTSSQSDCRDQVNDAIDYLEPLETSCAGAWGSTCRLLPDGCVLGIKDPATVFNPHQALCVPGSTASGIQLQADSCSSSQVGKFYLLNYDFFSAARGVSNAYSFSVFGWALAAWQASPMMCPPGRVMKGLGFEHDQLAFKLQCTPAYGIGKASSFTRTLHLGHTKATYCDGESLLLGVEATLSRRAGVQIELACAPPLGFTTYLHLSKDTAFEHSDLEMGIYCPKVEPLVLSGRPNYTEVIPFGDKEQRGPSIQAPLEINEDTGLWCFKSSSQASSGCLNVHEQGSAYGQSTPEDLQGAWATAGASVSPYALFSGSYPYSVPMQPTFDPSGVIPPKAIKKILKGSQKLLKGVAKRLLKMPGDLETEFDPTVSGPPGTPNSVPSTLYEPYCSSLSDTASDGPCAFISKTSGDGQISWKDIVKAQDNQDFANAAHWYTDTTIDNAKALFKIATLWKQKLCQEDPNTETVTIKEHKISGRASGPPYSGELDLSGKVRSSEGTGKFEDKQADCKSKYSDRDTYFNYAQSAAKRLEDGIFKLNGHLRYYDASMSAQRIWCDVFCAADREKKDTTAIQLSLQKSMQETEHNMAVLSKWLQVGTVAMGSLLFEQSDAFFALESLQLDKILENTEPQKASLLQMQTSLRQMVDEVADVSPVGETVANAALRRFDATMASAGTLQENQPNATQAKVLLDAYRSLYATLKHGVQEAKVQAQTPSNRKAQALNQKLALTSSIMSREARRLGFYRTALQHQEKRHGLLSKRSGLEALQVEVTDAAVSMILVDRDKIYWQVRATVSEFSDDEVRAHEAFTKSLGAIKNYVGCNTNHRDLLEEYRSAEKMHLEKQGKLRSTWRKVEAQAGLLASLITDGNVFSRLASYDAESINTSAAERAIAHLDKTSGCVLTLPAADAALKKLVYDTLKSGFFGQTLEQSDNIFDLAGFVHKKFSQTDQEIPSQEVIQEASEKVAQAHRLAMLQLDDIVLKLKASLTPSLIGCHN